MAKSCMVVGTSSNVGKSLVVAALCRIFKQDGWSVAPFKAQNMSLNAYVTPDGGEIGYAQALQAWAAGVPPRVEMNPILLKPQGNMTSQIILNGHPVGTYRAGDYYETFFDRGWQAVRDTLDRLSPEYDWLICEGAGSPAEMNLHHRDLTNMRVAKYLQAPTLLVADIDRGGALAHVVGTLQVLPEEERQLFAGIVINKFRGVLDLLQPGLDWLEEYTGLPVVGVLPWLDFALPAEDSMSLFEQRGSKRTAQIEIAVIRLPHIANFTDFDPLAAEPTVRVRFVGLNESLGSPDVAILPGSKATIADLMALQESGMAEQLQRFSGAIAGICGGMQMLGQAIADPAGYEGPSGKFRGLGLLPLETQLTGEKVTRQVSTSDRWLGESPILGYEIHQGRTTFGHSARRMFERDDLGCVSADDRVWGSYLHGLFDNHAWRRQWLNRLRMAKSLRPLPELAGHYSEDRDRLLDRLAEIWRPQLDLKVLGYHSKLT
ncbi:cobyric acid synthase [Synechococcus sp. PCC 7336]|uniref:cobyric acid synthase n=1 Tax=Synechococcus sp. PCC 7336 TaxID=195250 RepID=UPI00056F8215|nr:cobyric acid synthase [Synechococcus sp. PCC 7336]